MSFKRWNVPEVHVLFHAVMSVLTVDLAGILCGAREVRHQTAPNDKTSAPETSMRPRGGGATTQYSLQNKIIVFLFWLLKSHSVPKRTMVKI